MSTHAHDSLQPRMVWIELIRMLQAAKLHKYKKHTQRNKYYMPISQCTCGNVNKNSLSSWTCNSNSPSSPDSSPLASCSSSCCSSTSSSGTSSSSGSRSESEPEEEEDDEEALLSPWSCLKKRLLIISATGVPDQVRFSDGCTKQ
jgi:hypothetical protein